ncbi:MAG: hypothetical protein GAK29_01779 [Acinetobacter bereziniae]|uniref:Uncharacterized protein n=1 Tax=Acinetobacter bereziniae TaxID=106648 RepID=A0A833PHQ3_ACIBZ|nr:MAG: hypothetical protein GAK29_01779 [Acinetobacter bereziniae]
MNFKLKLGEIPNLGNIVNAVWRVNGKRGDVVLNAEDVGADKTGTAQEFANQAALNLENEVKELKKLIENSGGGSSVEWVRADHMGSFNASFGFGHGQINDKPAYLEFAKINGCLWMRGFMKIPYGNGLAYTITDKTYNVLTQNDSTSVILNLEMYLTPSQTRLWFRSDIRVSDVQTASDATQIFIVPDNSFNGIYHIPAQCLGILAN